MRCLRGSLFRAAFLGVLLFLLLRTPLALCETSVSFSPAEPRIGDYVDIAVITDSEDFKAIRYSLNRDGVNLFSGKKTEERLAASFRPRRTFLTGGM